MARYGIDDLHVFLHSIDEKLDQDLSVILIGGSAAILTCHGAFHTHDIDTFEQVTAIQNAAEAARLETHLEIPIQHAAVADAPYGFESRLQNYSRIPFKRLQILIPEKHDLVLMKMIRGDDHDIQHIKEIAERVKLEYGVLLSRFLEEMSHVIIDWRRLEENFLYMINELFGEEMAEETERSINAEGTWITENKRTFSK